MGSFKEVQRKRGVFIGDDVDAEDTNMSGLEESVLNLGKRDGSDRATPNRQPGRSMKASLNA